MKSHIPCVLCVCVCVCVCGHLTCQPVCGTCLSCADREASRVCVWLCATDASGWSSQHREISHQSCSAFKGAWTGSRWRGRTLLMEEQGLMGKARWLGVRMLTSACCLPVRADQGHTHTQAHTHTHTHTEKWRQLCQRPWIAVYLSIHPNCGPPGNRDSLCVWLCICVCDPFVHDWVYVCVWEREVYVCVCLSVCQCVSVCVHVW